MLKHAFEKRTSFNFFLSSFPIQFCWKQSIPFVYHHSSSSFIISVLGANQFQSPLSLGNPGIAGKKADRSGRKVKKSFPSLTTRSDFYSTPDTNPILSSLSSSVLSDPFPFPLFFLSCWLACFAVKFRSKSDDKTAQPVNLNFHVSASA